MRIVLDTNVVVSSLLWGGSPARLFDVGMNGGHEYFASEYLLVELRRVLTRRKFTKRISLSGRSVEDFVSNYLDVCVIVEPTAMEGIAPDPEDDLVIGTAVAANADLLVTGDKGLLSVRSYQGCRIVSVNDAMNVMIVR